MAKFFLNEPKRWGVIEKPQVIIQQKISFKKNSRVILASNSQKLLLNYINTLSFYCKELEVLDLSVVFLPITKIRITLLKSPHVNKKAKEHFENSTYKVQLKFRSVEDIARLKFFLFRRPTSIQAKIFF